MSCPHNWLTWPEIGEILRKSPQGQTTLIRRVPRAASGAPDDRDFQVDIRNAQVVTLAQMFAMGSHLCTAYDMYNHYLDLDIVIHKRKRECKPFREEHRTREQWEAPAPANKRARRTKW